MVLKRVPDTGHLVVIVCILAFIQTVTSLQIAGGLPLTYDLNLIQPPVTPVYTYNYNTVSGLNSVFAVPPPAPPPQLVPVTTQAHFQNDDLQLAEYIYQQLNEFTDSFKADPGSIKMSASLANPSAPGVASVRLHDANGPVANNIHQNIKVIQHGESGISAHYVSRPEPKPSSYQDYQHAGSQQPGNPGPRQQKDPNWNHHTAVVIANANSNAAPSSSSDMYERNQASVRGQPRPNPQAAHSHDRGSYRGSNPQNGFKNYEIVQSPLSAQESKRIEDELNAGRPAHLDHSQNQGPNDADSNHKGHENHVHTILPPIRYDDHTHSVEYYPLGTSSGNDRVTLGGSSASNPSVYYRTANRVTYPSVILKNSENVAIHYPSLQVGGNQEPSFEHNAYAAAMMTGVQWQNQQYKSQEAKQTSRPSSEKAVHNPTSEYQKFRPDAELNQVPSKLEQSYKRNPQSASNAFKTNSGGVKVYRNEPERIKPSYKKEMTAPNTGSNGEMMKSIGYEVSESKLPYRYSNGDGKRQVKDNNVGIWQPMNRTQTLQPIRINGTIVGVRKPGERPRPPKMLRERGKDSHLLVSESQTRPRSVKYSVSMVTRSKSKSRFPPARQTRPTAVQLTESKKRKRDGFRQNLARYVKKFRAMHARNVQRQNLSMKKLRRIWNQLSGSSAWEAKRY